MINLIKMGSFSILFLFLTGCGDAFKFQDPGILTDDIDMKGKRFIGDMLVDEDQLEEDFTASDEVSSQAATLRLSTRKRTKWKNGVVPYVFHKSAKSALRDRFKKAAAKWTSGTGVKFVKRKKQRVYLVVRADQSGCFASLGAPRDPGKGKTARATLNIQPGGCNRVGIIMHEIGHTLGMIHEHQRTDRNKYVEVLWGNVHSSGRGNFSIIKDSINRGSYDFASIMHYGPDNASKNGKRTLRTRPAYKQWNNKLGDPVIKHAKLSSKDKSSIKSFYGK